MPPEEGFTVYLRRPAAATPEEIETPLARFRDYQDAQRLLRLLHGLARQGIIRYEGELGGSD
jgi:hypothetical protein